MGRVKFPSNSERKQLRPSLSLIDATALGLGAIIGGGIFIVIGIVAGQAGPAMVLSILLAGLVSLLTALSFVDLAAWRPVEGGVYEFSRRPLAPGPGFLAGWMWLISNLASGAAVALGFAHYLAAIVPGLNYRVAAVSLCALFAALNFAGIKHSAALNNLLVLVKIGILLLFVTAGLPHIRTANFSPFLPSGLGVLRGAYFIFFAFAGFARITIVAEEVRDARKNVPRSIILALGISGLIYIVVGTAAIGLAGSAGLAASNSPLAFAIRFTGRPALVAVVSLGGMVATASVLLTSVLGVSRMAFAMARNGDLPVFLSRLHPRFKTPHLAVAAAGGIMILAALFVDLAGVVAVSAFSSLFYYSLANLSAFRLKREPPGRRRFLPLAAAALSLLLLAFMEPSALKIGALSLAAGMVFYGGKRVLGAGRGAA
jgi:APA family basic amino acid/polyamine antiporter